MVTGVFVSGTGDDHTTTLDAIFIVRRLQTDRHFRPQVKWRRALKFDTTFVDNNRISGKFKAGLPRLHGDVLLKQTVIAKFSCAHM